jgi:phospholipid/cholesterol/gamma-HCH transport system permease protein
LSAKPSLTVKVADFSTDCAASGAWTAVYAADLESMMDDLARQLGASPVTVDMRNVESFDTYGAWILERFSRTRKARGEQTNIASLSNRYRDLFLAVQEANLKPAPTAARQSALTGGLEKIGRATNAVGNDLVAIAMMLGAVAISFTRAVARPQTFRLTSAVNQLDRVGLQAVPIILLITFLIGGIIAQQGFFHFRKFGAELYVVDMLGILILREIGVLIVSIMVAGRSGSSYTAELGSMKMREEIDALRTMGLDPVAVLVLPRVIALVIGLTMLTFLGSMSALYGGGVVSWLYGDMSPEIFIARLQEAISTTHFKVGMIKAPFMALVIGVVACAEGFAVQGSAESLGRRTTASVVKAIFLVIVLDGLFAVFFAAIDM